MALYISGVHYMDNSTLITRLNFLNKNQVGVSENMKDEFFEEILDVNIHREKILGVVLILIDIAMLYSDIFTYDTLRKNTYSLTSLFYTHIVLLIVSSAFLLIFYIIERYKISVSLIFKKALHLSLSSSVLILCTFLSVNAILSKGQIYSFTIALFCIASMGLFTLYERLSIYLSTYLFFIIEIFAIRSSITQLFWLVFFITLLTVAAIIASTMNYSSYVNNFNKSKIILEKSKELDNMYKNVEESLRKRTLELTEANERLINEINAKHEVEIECMNTRILCEEKERILNETEEYEKLRTAFFANISHELRTPLNVIYSAEQMLALLLKEVKLKDQGDEISQYMHIIKQNCYRLIRIIANLIDITKIDAGYFQVNPRNCDIVKVVEDITLSVVKYAGCKGLDLTFDTQMEEKVISCDPDKIERIILNLLSNAVKFTPAGGEIYVNMYEKEGRVVISVKDNGIGIPPEMQGVIFDRFIQVDKTTSRTNEGSGIGLSLVKSLVEMHGGSISVKSECKKGSEFVIELPDRTQKEDAVSGKCAEIKGSGSIEKIKIEFSDIYFN